MKAVKLVVAIAVAGVAFMLHASYGVAQQVTGELGSPSATTTLSGAGGRRASCRRRARPTCCSS